METTQSLYGGIIELLGCDLYCKLKVIFSAGWIDSTWYDGGVWLAL
jgi:hypothetical protein